MADNTLIQFVDPEVTKTKFKIELGEFENLREDYRRKGIICLSQLYPVVSFIFAVPSLNPSPIAFAVKFDFTNWDVEPPSIIFINPFSGAPVKGTDVKLEFLQKVDTPIPGQFTTLDLLQARNTDSPFFCIPGVREYHQHPAHSGDPWMLHRTRGEGKLVTLLDQLYRHSIAQCNGYGIQMNFSITGINIDINKVFQ